MALSSLKRMSFLVALTVAAPLLCLPEAITANGTDEVGSGANPGTLASGQSISSGYNFVYTFAGDGDQYSVTTSYSATDSPVHVSFTAAASYIGNSGNASTPSAGPDTLNVDFLQNFAYTGSASASGSASALLTQTDDAPGSFTEAQLYFDGQGTGLMGPFNGPGSQLFSAGPTVLNSLGDPISGDFRYTFYFASGTAAVPEPGAAGFMALGLVILLGKGLRRFGFARKA